MHKILNEFLSHAKMSGETPFFPSDIAVLIIEKCKQEQVAIYGMDAAEITEVYTQPFMEHSVDYTASPYPDGYYQDAWDEAIQFIKSKEHLELYFEIVISE